MLRKILKKKFKIANKIKGITGKPKGTGKSMILGSSSKGGLSNKKKPLKKFEPGKRPKKKFGPITPKRGKPQFMKK
jgi:hypothetical protein